MTFSYILLLYSICILIKKSIDYLENCSNTFRFTINWKLCQEESLCYLYLVEQSDFY